MNCVAFFLEINCGKTNESIAGQKKPKQAECFGCYAAVYSGSFL